jgi:hypothetical protein
MEENLKCNKCAFVFIAFAKDLWCLTMLFFVIFHMQSIKVKFNVTSVSVECNVF